MSKKDCYIENSCIFNTMSDDLAVPNAFCAIYGSERSDKASKGCPHLKCFSSENDIKNASEYLAELVRISEHI